MSDIETPTPVAVAPAPRVSLGALRHRDFCILWVAVVISNIGTWMHIVAQGWLMYQLTNSAFWLGLVGLMRAIPLLAFPLAGGVIADRVQRITVLYVTQTAAALLALALAVITALGEVAAWHILVYAFLGASVLAFDGPAREALLPDLIDADNMMSAISLNSWAFNGAILLGPALAAMLLPSIGIAGVFALNAVSFGAVLIALPLLRAKGGIEPIGSARQNLADGLRYVADHPAILGLVLMTATVSLLGRSYGQLMPVFASDFLGLDAVGMSVLYTVAGLGTCIFACALVFLHDPQRKGWLALAAAVAFAIALCLFAVSRSLWVSEILLFIAGGALIGFSTSVTTLLQKLTPRELRGRVMSVNTIAWQGLEYVGVLLTGALAAVFAAPPVVVGAAVVMSIVVIGVALRQPEIVRLE
ncbi:MAG TPA: MFS transporter [Candidatus Dormibacteraeota bacterium]|nr:MFS transporter [Candidatus Dormibacteraeota bacterium]